MLSTYITFIIEALLATFIVFAICHEKALIKIEHAFVKAVIWELYEKFCEKDVKKLG